MPRAATHPLHDEENSTVAAAKYRALRHIWELRGPATASVAFSYIMRRRDGAAQEQSEE
jgi:hypothetical protein